MNIKIVLTYTVLLVIDHYSFQRKAHEAISLRWSIKNY